MVPSKSRKSDSRRSSILKPRKPRQPLQSVNLDFSSNENSPTLSKVKRRVSFAEKKHVKEFCHSTEQGTVWDNTYEEHDSSLKGSFTHEQNIESESKENASLYVPKNDCTYINSDSNPNCPQSSNLANNQLLQKIDAQVNEEDNANCSLDFTNPVGISKEGSQFEYSSLSNAASYFNHISKDTLVSGVISHDINEEYIESSKESQQFAMLNTVSDISKNVTSSNIIIYRDSDEEDCAIDIGNRCYSELCSNNVNSQLNDTHMYDLSMELTTPIPAFLLSSHLHAEKQKNVQKDDDTVYSNNLDTNTIDCNNVSMEMTQVIPISVKAISSDLANCTQIPILQNCENAKCDAANNTHDNTKLLTNLQSNIVSEQTQNINYINDSMVLTTVIQPLITDICHINNIVSNTSMEMTAAVPSKTYEINIPHLYNKNIIKENNKKKDETDKTEFFNNVPMEMTEPVNNALSLNINDQENIRINELISMDNRVTFFHNVSMEMTEAVPTRNRQEISNAVTCKLLPEENSHREKNTNESIFLNEKSLCKSMEFTEAVSVPLYHEKTINIEHVAQSTRKHEDDKSGKTGFFNDSLMKIVSPVNIVSPSNICDKENLKIEKSVSKDDRTTFFHNISMEMTEAVSLRNQKEITHPIICKSISEENTHAEKDQNDSACFNERTRLLCKSMEFTDAVPVPLYHERTFNTIHTAQSNPIQSFSQRMLEAHSPVENTAGSILQIDIATNEIIQNISMEITATIPSIMHRTQDVAPSETENLNASNNNASQNLITNNIQSVEVSHLIVPPTIHLSAEDSTGSVLQTDVTASKTIQNISMENTTAIPSTSHLTQNMKTVNEMENVTISKADLSEPRKSITKENFTISMEIMKTANTHDTLSNTFVTPSLRDNLDYSLSAILGNNKKRSNESEKSNLKRIRSSFVGSQFSEENNVHLSPRINDDNADRNECFIKGTVDHASASGSNLRDTLNEISECSFLRKSLPHMENDLVELHSIKPPSFVFLDSEEENSFHSALREDEFQMSMIASDVPVDNIHNSSNRLIIDNVTESECLAQSRKSIVKDYENISFSREKNVPINIKNNQIEDCQISNVANKNEDSQETIDCDMTKTIINDNQINKSDRHMTDVENRNEESVSSKVNANEDNQETIDCDVTTKTIINDNRINESDRHTTDVENLNEENVSSKVNANEDNQETIDCDVTTKTIINDNRINESNRYTMDVENLNEGSVLSKVKHGETVADPNINRCTSLIIKEIEIINEDKADKGENTRKKINGGAKLQNNIEEERQYSDVKKRLEKEECSNHIKRTETIIEDQVEPEEYCKENLNNEVKLQSIEQKEEECADKSLVEEQCISAIEDESLVEQDSFLSLLERLEIYAEREDCIWNVYHKNIDRKMIVFSFMSNSLLIVTFLSYDLNYSGENLIKNIKIISRVSDDAGVLIRIVHRLIQEKVSAEILTQLYRTHEELLPMLDFVSQDVKLAMDFMFDLKRLDDLNLMEIVYDEISFISLSKRMDIILKITIKVKRFDKLISNDIKINCLLGTIKETDVKNLIKNVKRDHKFLRRYMNDVRDYIDIMEETFR